VPAVRAPLDPTGRTCPHREKAHPSSSCAGLTCHLGYWWRVISLLNGVRIVALDFRGHGLSEHRDSYGYVHYERDLLSLLDALDLDQITVAGHSHGGYVALFAASRSEKIRRVPAIEVKSDWTHEDADLAERSRGQRSGSRTTATCFSLVSRRALSRPS
jgi:dipeptidyl aminopeptidase/acylaminoacyl peptidase